MTLTKLSMDKCGAFDKPEHEQALVVLGVSSANHGVCRIEDNSFSKKEELMQMHQVLGCGTRMFWEQGST